LYTLTVTLIEDGATIDVITKKIGFRHIELIQDKDQWGESFYFRLNGVPIFAKGANWIPVDSFISRGKKHGLYERLLRDSKAANMNMIRVWGGGIYEEDLFYNLCDEMGLLVWQDFAFACNPTPRHQMFFDQAAIEAEYNIKRLRHHPCLAIWVGNNEIEQAWVSWGYSVRFPKLKKAYTHLFEELLPSIASTFDPDRPYWPSSPSSGGDFKKPNSPDSGDSHFWMVWHGGKPFTSYRKHFSRFMSEFGYESFPDHKTVLDFCPENQMGFYSRVMKSHQKCFPGNRKLMKYMKRRFHVPNDFHKQLLISQITQAEAVEYGVDHWRRNRKSYRCMGALYWQLNDCWPVISWSSIDYYGRWKALHYFARRFFAPVYCSVAEFSNRVEFWGVNDLNENKAVSLVWSMETPAGMVVDSGKQHVELHRSDAQLIKEIYMGNQGVQPEDKMVFWALLDQNNREVVRGCKLLTPPKNYDFQNPELELKVDNDKNNSVIVHITAKAPALYVFIESPYEFIASDNFFPLRKGETISITIEFKGADSIDGVKDNIKVRSLYDITGSSYSHDPFIKHMFNGIFKGRMPILN